MPFDRLQLSSGLLLLSLTTAPPAGAHWLARVVFGVGLVFPLLTRRSATYWTIALLLAATAPMERSWLSIDNHEYLQLYWLAAFALSRAASRPTQMLRTTARWLLALVFVFATAWKLLSPDFADGSAIEFFFGIEHRMGDVAAAFGLQDEEVVNENWEELATWRQAGQSPGPVALRIGEEARQVAPALAWATILIEGAVALAFLLPLQHRQRRLRDITLLAFILLTYPLAPVLPFAWVLLSLGAMQSDLASRRRNVVYLGVFLITIVYALRAWTLFPLIEAMR